MGVITPGQKVKVRFKDIDASIDVPVDKSSVYFETLFYLLFMLQPRYL